MKKLSIREDLIRIIDSFCQELADRLTKEKIQLELDYFKKRWDLED